MRKAVINLKCMFNLTKIDLVELELSNNDIILLSETHLNDDIVDGDIQIKGYQCPIRKKRNRQGGGIAIYTKHHIYRCEKPEFNSDEIEII
jgi:exonuclease III